nr:MAG TPA: hypothetical protein [Caudoviricetes sp.]
MLGLLSRVRLDYQKEIYTEPAMNALCKSNTRVEFKVLCLILM